MHTDLFPKDIPNWINGKEQEASGHKWFDKINPANGECISRAARSGSEDVLEAVTASKKAQIEWANTPAVQRGMVLNAIVKKLEEHQGQIAAIVALETGKSHKEAYGETGGAIALGLFYASEGQRLYGRTSTSSLENKYAMTVRQPVGIAGVIVPANTPIANVAWKIFPALICGNAVVLKASEDSPATAWIVGKLAKEAGLSDGLLNIIQGYGEEAGAPIVSHPDVGVISFTGSTGVGRMIQQVAGQRLAKVSLELGGKNPLVVCDDADLDNAAKWVLLSAFSNAGQRCASGSRIIIFDSVYDKFRQKLIDQTRLLKVGNTDEDDLGPVINEKQLNNMLNAVVDAKEKGARIIEGGVRMTDGHLAPGFYMAPTLIEDVAPDADISTCELFGPIACLYRVNDFADALALANDSPYGLTACIHTRDFNRAMEFAYKVEAGVAMVNAGTYGSEPNMPFGGVKQSGNGTREPGSEAIDIYSELKNICLCLDPKQV